jgi:hypothetical protein
MTRTVSTLAPAPGLVDAAEGEAAGGDVDARDDEPPGVGDDAAGEEGVQPAASAQSASGRTAIETEERRAATRRR